MLLFVRLGILSRLTLLWNFLQCFINLSTLQIRSQRSKRVFCPPFRSIFISTSCAFAGWDGTFEREKGGGERRLDLVPRLTRFLSQQTNKQTVRARPFERKRPSNTFLSSLLLLSSFHSSPSSLPFQPFVTLSSTSKRLLLSLTLFSTNPQHLFFNQHAFHHRRRFLRLPRRSRCRSIHLRSIPLHQ